MRKLTFQVSGIDRVLHRFQSKHCNARYNPDPFEQTAVLSFCVPDTCHARYLLASVSSSSTAPPDVNFGVNSSSFTIMKRDGSVRSAPLNHVTLLKSINEKFIDISPNGIASVRPAKKKTFIDIDVEIDEPYLHDNGDDLAMYIFINFYHILDKNDDEKKDGSLKITSYMASFYNVESTAPASILKVSRKITRYICPQFTFADSKNQCIHA